MSHVPDDVAVARVRDVVVEGKEEGVDARAGLYNEAANLRDNVMIDMRVRRMSRRRRRRRRRRSYKSNTRRYDLLALLLNCNWGTGN